MRNVRFFHTETGILHPNAVVASDDKAVELNTPPGHEAIDNPVEGRPYDHLSQRVEIATKTVVDYQPTAPSAEHEWDGATKRWRLSVAIQQKNAARTAALMRIRELEHGPQPRALREMAIGIDGAKERLQAIDAEIANLRMDL